MTTKTTYVELLEHGGYAAEPAVSPDGRSRIYFNSTTNLAMISQDGAAYVPLVSGGPAGATGPQGPQGWPGDDGADGADGAPGTPGANGANGAAGATGATGPAGPAGPQGWPGEDGADGLQGEQGPAGPQGTAGSNGAAGATGPAGPTGATGPQGWPGEDGADGAEGPPGPQGATGSSGSGGDPAIRRTEIVFPSTVVVEVDTTETLAVVVLTLAADEAYTVQVTGEAAINANDGHGGLMLEVSSDSADPMFGGGQTITMADLGSIADLKPISFMAAQETSGTVNVVLEAFASDVETTVTAQMIIHVYDRAKLTIT